MSSSNPANTIIVTPPQGANQVTLYAGVAGPTGPTGPKGDQGIQGNTGPTGATGPKGDTGAVGPSNSLSVGGTATGAPGSSAIVSLIGNSPSQSIYFTIPSGVKGDTGPTGPQGSQGIQGIQGIQGNTGATGASPTLSVNSLVGSVPSGTQGSASLSGTATNPILNLTLPAGPTGNTGLGYDGVTSSSSITVSNATKTFTVNKTGAFAVGSRVLIAYASSPSIIWMAGVIYSISGTQWQVAVDAHNGGGSFSNWTISETGPTGASGSNGSSPTLSVNSNVDTLAYGNNGIASLDNTNALDPVLYLTLPAGPQGQSGPQGNTGATGATPTLSVNSTVATVSAGNTGTASIGGTLPNSPKLYLTLPAGSDASVTSANITSALGYTPIGDAPDTLHQYARTKGAWVTISGGGGGNPFDQNLNTTDSPSFVNETLNYPDVSQTTGFVGLDVLGGQVAGTNYDLKLGYSGSYSTDCYGLFGSGGYNGFTLAQGGSISNTGYCVWDADTALVANKPLLGPGGQYGSGQTWKINADGSALFSSLELPDVSQPLVCRGGAGFGYNGGGSPNFTIDESGNIYQSTSGTSSFANGYAQINSDGSAYFSGNNAQIGGDGSCTFISGHAQITFANNAIAQAVFSGYNSGYAQLNDNDSDYGKLVLGGANVSSTVTTERTSDASNNDIYGLKISSTGYIAVQGNNFAVNSDGSIKLAPANTPSSPSAGQIYFDTNDAHFYGYNGTSWVQLDN